MRGREWCMFDKGSKMISVLENLKGFRGLSIGIIETLKHIFMGIVDSSGFMLEGIIVKIRVFWTVCRCRCVTTI